MALHCSMLDMGVSSCSVRFSGMDDAMMELSKHDNWIEVPILPVPKPRQTRADKWKKRPAVLRYRAFSDECRLRNVQLPEAGAHIIFVIPMPKSWSRKRRDELRGQAHCQKPDSDNLLKALMDAVHKEDSGVWDARVTKVWGDTGKILIKPPAVKLTSIQAILHEAPL